MKRLARYLAIEQPLMSSTMSPVEGVCHTTGISTVELQHLEAECLGHLFGTFCTAAAFRTWYRHRRRMRRPPHSRQGNHLQAATILSPSREPRDERQHFDRATQIKETCANHGFRPRTTVLVSRRNRGSSCGHSHLWPSSSYAGS